MGQLVEMPICAYCPVRNRSFGARVYGWPIMKCRASAATSSRAGAMRATRSVAALRSESELSEMMIHMQVRPAAPLRIRGSPSLKCGHRAWGARVAMKRSHGALSLVTSAAKSEAWQREPVVVVSSYDECRMGALRPYAITRVVTPRERPPIVARQSRSHGHPSRAWRAP